MRSHLNNMKQLVEDKINGSNCEHMCSQLRLDRRLNDLDNTQCTHMVDRAREYGYKNAGLILDRGYEDLRAYEKHFKLEYDSNGYLQSYKRNEIQKEIDRLGFFVIVTSKEMTSSDALDIYRKRDSVEKIFRMLKTGLEYDTFRIHSQNSLERKTYVMFIASIVRNYIFQGLKEISRKEKDKKNYTVPVALGELEKVTVVKNSKDVYIRRYGLTAKQKKTMDNLELPKAISTRLQMG